MRTVTFPDSFLPLVDATPLIVVREIGFDLAKGYQLVSARYHRNRRCVTCWPLDRSMQCACCPLS